MSQGKLKLTYLPENTQLLSGDQVLTSGMGGVYPSGLVVGTIDEILTEASGMGRYAVLTPATHLDELRQVFVITDFDIVE
jgi:rod shape-determining protein MreC